MHSESCSKSAKIFMGKLCDWDICMASSAMKLKNIFVYTIGYENIYTQKYFLRIFYDTKINQSTVVTGG